MVSHYEETNQEPDWVNRDDVTREKYEEIRQLLEECSTTQSYFKKDGGRIIRIKYKEEQDTQANVSREVLIGVEDRIYPGNPDHAEEKLQEKALFQSAEEDYKPHRIGMIDRPGTL